jgi:hypothetical protein
MGQPAAMLTRFAPGLVGLAAVLLATGVAAPIAASDRPAMLLLEQHCGDCHRAPDPAQGLVLAAAAGVAVPATSDLPTLERLAERVRSHTMPPPDAEPPLTDEDRGRLLDWLDERIDRSVGDLHDPGTVGIRRLTRTEYRHTVRDLLRPELPDMDLDVTAFPSDDVAYGFDNIAAVNALSPLLMERYAETAESLGSRWAAAARVLAMPAFLFRIEQDGPIGQDRPLDGFELASRLSYFLWSTMPDERLLAAARSGELTDEPGLRRTARSLLADPRIAQGLVGTFASQWLQTRRLAAARPDRSAFPGFDEPLRRAAAT